jgi:hypothetical protein
MKPTAEFAFRSALHAALPEPAKDDVRVAEIRERVNTPCPKCKGSKTETRYGYSTEREIVSSCRLCKGTGKLPIDHDIPYLLERLDAIAARLAAAPGEEGMMDKLKEAWERINALGSPNTAEDPNDQFAKGVNQTVDAALQIIRELRKHIHVRSENGDACAKCGEDLRSDIHVRW